MRTSRLFFLFVLLLDIDGLHAQCSPTGSGSPITGPDYVVIHTDASFANVAPNATCEATQMWSSTCTSSPGVPQFTVPECAAVYGSSGASFSSRTVYYRSGYDPNNSQACAETSGSTITVYEKALVTSNGSLIDKQCGDFGFENILAHEVGHALGLADIPGSCGNNGDIMAQLSVNFGFPNSVTWADCQTAYAQSPSIDKNNPVDYSCSQSCYTYCYGGSCPATNYGSPIVINITGGPLELTGIDDPVTFDLYNNARPVRTAWSRGASTTGFLCLDLNNNGEIENAGELFGNHTYILGTRLFAANGFEALNQYDRPENGGNGDGQITAADTVFASLRMWIDANHNGKTDAGELMTLPQAGIVSIDLAYRLDNKKDQHGNLFRYHGRAERQVGNATKDVSIYDVFFDDRPPQP